MNAVILLVTAIALAGSGLGIGEILREKEQLKAMELFKNSLGVSIGALSRIQCPAMVHRAFISIALLSAFCPAQVPYSSAQLNARVEALLKQMTLEEKVGQMTQVTLEMVSQPEGAPGVAHKLDAAK